MNVQNLFKIEDILKSNDVVYDHVSPFIGAEEVDTLIGGIKEENSDNYLRKYTGNVIIVWCEDELERENLWQQIYRGVECKRDETVRVWFYTSLADEPIMVIPIEF